MFLQKTKMLKIDKSNLIILAPLLLFVVVFLATVFIKGPGVAGYFKDFRHKKEELELLYKKQKKLAQLLSIKDANKDSFDKVDKAIQDSLNAPMLFSKIENLAQASLLDVKDISISDDASQKLLKAGGFSTGTLRAEFSGSFSAFENFLEDLEKSLPLMDVLQIDFDLASLEVFNFRVEIATYSI